MRTLLSILCLCALCVFCGFAGLSQQRSEAHTTEAQRVIAMADRASELLFTTLAQDGLGLTALFGLPTPAQREAANDAAREMHELTIAAEQAIDHLIRAIESSPEFNTDAALQQQRRELAFTHRDVRIAFLRGIAAFLHAEWNTDEASAQRSLYALSDRTLSHVAEILEGAAAIEARLYAGLAKVRVGEFERAETMFGAAARDAAASPVHVFTARMGSVLNRTIRGGPTSGLDALASVEQRYLGPSAANVLYRVIIADQRFLLRRQLTADKPSDALASYTDLLRSAAPLGVPRDTTRAIVLARLATALTLIDAPLDSLPALAQVAHADRLSREPGTRARAIELLERLASIASDPAINGEARPSALFILGRALYEHQQPLFAAQRFIELAANYPNDAHAARAVELGVSIAADLDATVRAERSAVAARAGEASSETRALLRAGLNLMLERYADRPTIDRWRVVAANIALDERRFDDANAVLTDIAPDSALWLDATVMQATVAHARALNAPDQYQKRRLLEQMLAAIDAAAARLSSAGAKNSADHRVADHLAQLSIYRADAQVRLDQPHIALQTLDEINLATAASALQAQGLVVRLAAFHAMRQPDEAIRTVEQFMRAAPEQAGDVLLSILASMQRDVQVLIDYGRDDQARELAQRTLLPAARLLERWLDEQPRAADHARRIDMQFRWRIAEALRLSGEYSAALTEYDRLLAQSPDAADVLIGRAECLFGMGGELPLADAMTIYKRLAATAVPGGLHHDIHWLAQLRMLQILDRMERHTEQIVPRIERLRQQDESFGGERFKRGFDSLRLKHLGR